MTNRTPAELIRAQAKALHKGAFDQAGRLIHLANAVQSALALDTSSGVASVNTAAVPNMTRLACELQAELCRLEALYRAAFECEQLARLAAEEG